MTFGCTLCDVSNDVGCAYYAGKGALCLEFGGIEAGIVCASVYSAVVLGVGVACEFDALVIAC